MKFRTGDLVIDSNGTRGEVIKIEPEYPNPLVVVWSFEGHVLYKTYHSMTGQTWGLVHIDMKLDLDRIVNKMWEEYEV